MPAEGRVEASERIVVVAAGPGPHVPGLPDGSSYVIAADGGLDRCRELGVAADLVVGDLDSASRAALAAHEERGGSVVRHPARKDATDLELALDEALARGARRVLVIGSAEGRLDHLLSSVLLLGHERFAGLELDAALGGTRVHVVRGERTIPGRPGSLVTLLAVGGAATGVSTAGLEYPLHEETLEPGSSRGVSNVLLESEATIAVANGCVLAVLPEDTA
jgi:thiamine pyrophosphokinase